jgi:MerR family mercuric resistance operon transcriptional regulator
MSATYSISELASAAHVAVSTVRYYEREGLLLPDGRTESRYRVYGQRSLVRLRFIRSAQTSGLALSDVKALLSLRDNDTVPCGDVRLLLGRRLEETEQRLADLRHVRALLRSSLEACREQPESGPCRVIRRLDEKAAGEAPDRPRHVRSRKS